MFAFLVASFPATSAVVAMSGSNPPSLMQVGKLRGGGTTVLQKLEAFADVEADSEMGNDLGLDLSVQDTITQAGGPATLAEYCAGPKPGAELPEPVGGTKVKADWGGYGTKYKGKVQEPNADGTVDIKYDDGFTEKNVKMDDVRIRKKQKKSIAKQLAGKPNDDPACKLQEVLKKLQDKLKALSAMVGEFLEGQRAQAADKELPKPPPIRTTPAPKVAPKGGIKPGSKEEAAELESLKEELAGLDSYIKELQAQKEEYNKQIKADGAPTGPTAKPGVKTVDDLINEYLAKIADRQSQVKQLLQDIKEQKAELAKRAGGPMSLDDIVAAVEALEKEVEEAKKKRDELKKSGKLDPELEAVIDAIIESIGKIRKKVDNLVALEEKAEADKIKAEEEAKAAEAAARKKAREEGKDEEEAAAEAAAAAKKKAAAAKKNAELEAMKAANEVQQDLKGAEEGTTKLDTGLHPHGDKWWRYRYEHSHIEALVMIFISSLMLMWSEFWRRFRHQIAVWSSPIGVAPPEDDELQADAHGAIYTIWLKSLADQMLVCIFVFLTVWLIAKTPLIDIFPMVIKPSENMHVPHNGAEYRHLALDICTIFFFAIVFYFGLMFAVATAIRETTSKLEVLETSTPRDAAARISAAQASSVDAARAATAKASAKAMGDIVAPETWENLRKHFVVNVGEMMKQGDPQLEEVSRLVNDDFNRFPLAKYLKFKMRVQGADLFKFSWTMWLPTIGLFMILWALHRYAHMGYVRIMCFAGCVVLVLIICMGLLTKNLLKQFLAEPEGKPSEEREKSIHEKLPTEAIVLTGLEFSLFFVCYGVARMICQPWMWELHFWPVLILTGVAIVASIAFYLLIAPGIPSFIAVMAMPPYLSPDDIDTMKAVAQEQNAQALTPGRQSHHEQQQSKRN